MKVLHIDSSITGAHSASRSITAAIVERLRRAEPGLSLTYRDLAAAPIAHLAPSQLPAGHPLAGLAAAPDADGIATGQAALDEFLAADTVVIGAPMYNFTIPSQLKAWIDRIAVAGKTFRYGPNGPEGLAGGKRVIVAISRGGFYGAESPFAAAEHVETYLRAVFGFIGIAPEIIVAEGIQVSPEQRGKAIDGALQAAASLRAA